MHIYNGLDTCTILLRAVRFGNKYTLLLHILTISGYNILRTAIKMVCNLLKFE